MTSDAVWISEIAELRRHLWMLIALCKQVAHELPAQDRVRLIDAMMEAERYLVG